MKMRKLVLSLITTLSLSGIASQAQACQKFHAFYQWGFARSAEQRQLVQLMSGSSKICVNTYEGHNGNTVNITFLTGNGINGTIDGARVTSGRASSVTFRKGALTGSFGRSEHNGYGNIPLDVLTLTIGDYTAQVMLEK
jgi:hypothetical protein